VSNEEALAASEPAPNEAGIDFETWAALSARLLKLDQEARFDLLEEREIDPTDFLRAEARWVKALSDDLSNDRMDRVDAYASLCAAEMQRRAAIKEQEPIAVAAPAPAPIEKRLAHTPAPAKPAKQSEPPPLAPPPPPPPPVVLFTPEPPRAPPPPPAPALIVSSPAVVRAPSLLSGTMMASEPLPGVRPAAAALPFGQAPSAEFVAEMSGPRPSAPEAAIGGATLPLGVDLLGKLRQELPFLKATAAAAAPATTWPRLSLDTYASLCAELSVFPERVPEILKKYGIADEAGRRGVDREWAERLAAHPETQDLWQRKVGEFRAWLLRGGR
jgi:hypothetical protein